MTQLQVTTTDVHRKSFVPVPVDVFTADGLLDFALYIRRAGNDITLACPAGEPLPQKLLNECRTSGLQVLYVDTAEHRKYQKHAEAALTAMIHRDDVPTKRKAELCYHTTRELVKNAVESSHVDTFVGERRELWATNLVTLILSDETAVDGMVSMLSHDYYTYTHMVNVSVMVSALAYRLGERDPNRLRMLASGGLLHDVGKMRINPDTLNKVGRLTGQEWEELRSHPNLGLSFLHNRQGIEPQELMMVYQHHEKLDGSGYPSGLCGSEISVEAQMTAVVDIYDALTCKRPYRSAMTHEKACGILDEEAARKINAEFVAAWKETINRALAEGRKE
jgi:HD-GYP domain-containing protein (c-di-GMP phosphodiesterase class II)